MHVLMATYFPEHDGVGKGVGRSWLLYFKDRPLLDLYHKDWGLKSYQGYRALMAEIPQPDPMLDYLPQYEWFDALPAIPLSHRLLSHGI